VSTLAAFHGALCSISWSISWCIVQHFMVHYVFMSGVSPTSDKKTRESTVKFISKKNKKQKTKNKKQKTKTKNKNIEAFKISGGEMHWFQSFLPLDHLPYHSRVTE
jgi:mannitol-specific phosphotransferase system IIBC component